MKHIVNGQSGGEKLKYVLKGEGKRFLHGDVDVHCMNIYLTFMSTVFAL